MASPTEEREKAYPHRLILCVAACPARSGVEVEGRRSQIMAHAKGRLLRKQVAAHRFQQTLPAKSHTRSTSRCAEVEQ